MTVNSIAVNTVHFGEYAAERTGFDGEYMLIFLKSRCLFRINERLAKAECGDIVIFENGFKQDFTADESLLIYDWICFSTDGDKDFVDSLELPINKIIRSADSYFTESMIENIANEFYSLSARRTKMTDSLLKTILIRISESSGLRNNVQSNADPHYIILSELREKIYRNPQRKWNVDSMAAEVNMSRSYFQHIYRDTFGVSCVSDVISAKIEKAKEILSETSCTVSQAAAICGYDNEEHFMRQFKKIVGVTPTVYRKK